MIVDGNSVSLLADYSSAAEICRRGFQDFEVCVMLEMDRWGLECAVLLLDHVRRIGWALRTRQVEN